jgi:hypothetical protein
MYREGDPNRGIPGIVNLGQAEFKKVSWYHHVPGKLSPQRRWNKSCKITLNPGSTGTAGAWFPDFAGYRDVISEPG